MEQRWLQGTLLTDANADETLLSISQKQGEL